MGVLAFGYPRHGEPYAERFGELASIPEISLHHMKERGVEVAQRALQGRA